jgi:hypothetical protein
MKLLDNTFFRLQLLSEVVNEFVNLLLQLKRAEFGTLDCEQESEDTSSLPPSRCNIIPALLLIS